MRILSVSEMRALESTADMAGHSYAQMMELAGQAIARAILHRMPVKSRRVLILVGPGNNGGDGLVAARFLREAGAVVTAYLSQPRSDEVFRQAQEAGVILASAQEDPHGEGLARAAAQAHIVIDALLGTGATPPLRGAVAEILRTVGQAITQAQAPVPALTSLNYAAEPSAPRPFVVAVDGPSGLNFDTGEISEVSLEAHMTVTFAAPKWGHFQMPGATAVGELVVADIGIPRHIAIPGEGPEVVTPEMVRGWLPARRIDAHKGSFGKALIVAGSVNYTGAAILAATAAVRSGAGLVTLAIPSSLHEAIVPALPEATHLLLPHSLGVLNTNAVPLLMERIAHYTAVLIGSGLSNTAESAAFLRGLLGVSQGQRGAGFLAGKGAAHAAADRPHLPPLVIDADGLNILAETPEGLHALPPGTILTPHPGEMARLTGEEIADVEAHRREIAAQKAAAWGHVVVLKGAFTVVAAPDGRTALLPFANPALSTAGTGDVLAGTITALRAQGLAAFEAAAAGAYLHGLAGEFVRRRMGPAGAAASDVARALPDAWRCLAG